MLFERRRAGVGHPLFLNISLERNTLPLTWWLGWWMVAGGWLVGWLAGWCLVGWWLVAGCWVWILGFDFDSITLQWFYPFPTANVNAQNNPDALKHVADLF